MAPTRIRAFAVALIALAIIGGCGRRRPTSGGKARQLKKSELTRGELKYGIAPIPDATVTYQPDVVVVGGGGDAIRAQSSNGFIWTIEASAPHASELEPGKVFFMTNRAVGRVLDVRREGRNLIVVVGPVNLTDVIQEGHIAIDMPVDFDEAIPYTSSDMPGQIDSFAQVTTPADYEIRPAAYNQSPPAVPAVPPTTPDVSNLVNFKVTPIVNRFGVGLEANSNADGLKLYTQATIHIAKPELKADIDITPTGGIVQAYISLSGGAGMTWKFSAGTNVGRRANVKGILTPDTDFSLPVGNLGPVPVAVTVRQRLVVETALGVRDTTLSAYGDYTFNGGFKAGIINKQWDIQGPTDFVATQNMMKTANGISLGAAGLDLTDEIKVIAGIGAHGFAAGPYFRIVSALGVFKGSSMGMIECKEATIDVKLSGGVGYVIPKVVTKLFNEVLRALNIKYRLEGEGGIASNSSKTLYNDTSTMGGCKAGKE